MSTNMLEKHEVLHLPDEEQKTRTLHFSLYLIFKDEGDDNNILSTPNKMSSSIPMISDTLRMSDVTLKSYFYKLFKGMLDNMPPGSIQRKSSGEDNTFMISHTSQLFLPFYFNNAEV